MDTCRIYLSGSMSDSTWEEQTKWRQKFKDAIKFGDYDYEKKVSFFDPTQYYNFQEKRYKTEKEVMEFDLYNLRQSNLVVVNMHNTEKSLGTMSELILAKEYRIPVIAFGINGQEIHPWLLECCTRVCDDLREAVEYTVEFFLN